MHAHVGITAPGSKNQKLSALGESRIVIVVMIIVVVIIVVIIVVIKNKNNSNSALPQALEPWRARGGIYLEAQMGVRCCVGFFTRDLRRLKWAKLMPTPLE